MNKKLAEDEAREKEEKDKAKEKSPKEEKDEKDEKEGEEEEDTSNDDESAEDSTSKMGPKFMDNAYDAIEFEVNTDIGLEELEKDRINDP